MATSQFQQQGEAVIHSTLPNGRILSAVRLILGVMLLSSVALAKVNLEWRISAPVVRVGDPVAAGLYAVSDNGLDQPFIGLDALITWDPTVLVLEGKNDNGPFNWQRSQFPDDSLLDGLNADCWPNAFCPTYTFLPFNDGNAFYQALVFVVPDPPPMATADGLLVTTILFTAIRSTTSTELGFLPITPSGFSSTKVVHSQDGATQVVTGDLRSFFFSIAECGTRGDFNGDCSVGRVDWTEFELCLTGPGGFYVTPSCRTADIDGDGDADLRDAALLQSIFFEP